VNIDDSFIFRAATVSQDNDKTDFESASEEKQLSLIQEFWQFVLENRKWWLIPILVSLGLIGLVVALGSTGAAPFIYTLF
tara:strand:+ start:255266 stop:255505 length:240 start_codon:yes stop_codon:yes gene_type:complete